MSDTIVAISTALGVGAISLIRLSGPEAILIVNKVFSKDLTDVSSHTIHYGHIKKKEEIIDEVLVTVMRSPKTFTTEDVVEINCHGGIQVTEDVLKLLLQNGARLAEPGEFTKRAFLNGRIDLVEAESVMDLIESKTKQSRKLAISQLNGNLSRSIERLRQKLLDVISAIEVNIDYPEYEDIEEMTNEKVLPHLKNIQSDLETILKKSESGRVIKEGIKTVIVGRPNVGKSSLLNQLLEEDKAIVTDIEGTTRDVVEGTILVDGILLQVLDTAGIRETEDKIEQLGVQKSLKLIEEASFVLVVLNGSEALTKEDEELLHLAATKPSLVLINKNDLPIKIDTTMVDQYHPIYMNTKEEKYIDQIKSAIRELFQLDGIENDDFTYLSNARQIGLATEAQSLVNEAIVSIEKEVPIDLVESDVKRAWETLGEITGKTYQEELLDHLFSHFCVGK